MIVVGVDPGVSGAFAIVRAGLALVLEDAPVIRVGKSRRVPDVPGMVDLLARVAVIAAPGERVGVVIEQQGGRPGQATFLLGRNAGLWEGCVAALGLPYMLANAAAWKRAIGVGRDKGLSRVLASRLFPGADLGKRSDEGRAEALLLATYGERIFLARSSAT